MKFSKKIFIFEVLLQLHPTQRCEAIKRHLESPCIGTTLLRRKLGVVFLQGLFICSWFQILHSLPFYSNLDKGACKRYTLIQKIIGTCNSCRHRQGGNSTGLFAGAFSLFFVSFVLVTASVLFSFFRFSFGAHSLFNSSI